jgi:hypothetical protein
VNQAHAGAVHDRANLLSEAAAFRAPAQPLAALGVFRCILMNTHNFPVSKKNPIILSKKLSTGNHLAHTAH